MRSHVAARPPFLLTARELGDATVMVSVAGELDVATAPRLRENLEDILDRGGRRIVIDLRDVTFVDSLSVAAIVAARDALGIDGRLALVAGHPHVLMIFEIGGVDEMVALFHTCDEAVAHVRSADPQLTEPARGPIRWADGFGGGAGRGALADG